MRSTVLLGARSVMAIGVPPLGRCGGARPPPYRTGLRAPGEGWRLRDGVPLPRRTGRHPPAVDVVDPRPQLVNPQVQRVVLDVETGRAYRPGAEPHREEIGLRLVVVPVDQPLGHRRIAGGMIDRSRAHAARGVA